MKYLMPIENQMYWISLTENTKAQISYSSDTPHAFNTQSCKQFTEIHFQFCLDSALFY